MTRKKAITLATDDSGKIACLYAGDSASAALKHYEAPPKGTHFVELFRFPIPFKKRTTQERATMDAAVQEAHQKASLEAQAKIQSEAKAKADKEAKKKASDLKAAQEENLKSIDADKKKRAAELAAVHEQLAKTSAEKAKS